MLCNNVLMTKNINTEFKNTNFLSLNLELINP